MAGTTSPLPLFGAYEPAPAEDPFAEDTGPVLEPPPPPVWAGPLVQTGWPLLSTIGRIVAGATASDTAALRTALTGQIRRFEQAAIARGIVPRDVSAARYTLCSALDEAILLSSWGRASDWNQGTLLSRFHGETWGGEKVFAIIERVLQAPDRHPDLAELLHTILLLGFQGRYRVERDGTAKADLVRSRLLRALPDRAREPLEIAPARGNPVPRVRTVHTPLPVWTVALLCLLVVLGVFGILRYSLQSQADAVARTIDGLIPVRAVAPSPPGAPQ